MGFLVFLLKQTALLTAICFLFAVLYAIISTIVGLVVKDITSLKKYYEVKAKYEELLVKALNIDKELQKLKENYSVDNITNKE